MTDKPFTHHDLVKIAEKWLLGARKCSFVFTELRCYSTTEIPDAIGFRDGNSILVECKTSRADFLSDAKKFHRRHPHLGAGTYRFMLCPEGIIKPSELPERWGLVVVNKNGKPRQVFGPKSNCLSRNKEFHHERNMVAEMGMMVSALRRLHLQGVLPMIYDNPFINKERSAQ